MNGGWRTRAGRLFPGVLLCAGTGLFACCLLFASVGLVEGVTHRFGEGERLPQESPDQVRTRLAVVGSLLAGAAVGWVMARLGDLARRPGPPPWRSRLARLAAELPLVLGGLCLGVAVLVGVNSRQAVYEVGEEYWRVAIGGAVAGPALLVLGWVWRRRVGRGPS
jgi:hypothetical protein